MIKVNLLPQELAAESRAIARPAGAVPGGAFVALSLVLAYMVVFVLGFLVFYRKYQSDQDKIKAQREHDAVKAQIAKWETLYKNLKVAKALYENQLEVLNSLDPPERLLWCEKINLLPQLVPEGVYLSRINVSQEVKEVETAESLRRQREWVQGGSKGPKPIPIKKPVIKQTLTIEGVAYVEGGQSDKRLELVIKFLNNLSTSEPIVPYTKKPKSFMENFEGDIFYEPIVGALIADREVSKFVFKLRTRPL